MEFEYRNCLWNLYGIRWHLNESNCHWWIWVNFYWSFFFVDKRRRNLIYLNISREWNCFNWIKLLLNNCDKIFKKRWKNWNFSVFSLSWLIVSKEKNKEWLIFWIIKFLSLESYRIKYKINFKKKQSISLYISNKI